MRLSHVSSLSLWLLTALTTPVALGGSFQLPGAGNDLIGQVMVVRSRSDQTLLDIARAFGIGQEEMQLANPTVDRWLPGADSVVVVPDRYILPRGERRGLMLNLPEMRLYEFPGAKPGERNDSVVYTYPTSIGRMDWKTPWARRGSSVNSVTRAGIHPSPFDRKPPKPGTRCPTSSRRDRTTPWDAMRCA